MTAEQLQIGDQPRLRNGRMVLAFSGWMDGGTVSTGTVEWLAKTLSAQPSGRIDPEGFYLYNFPGPMEITAVFRPYAKIEDGRITGYRPPKNLFFCSEGSALILFSGKEPDFNWDQFADCIFSYAAQAGVSTLYFVGSYSGMVPHTREPRLFTTLSDDDLKPQMEQAGVRLTNYEGPASFSTHLLNRAPKHGVRMASLVAEIPAYIQNTNPKCIEAVVRKLGALLGLPVNLEELRALSTAWEERLTNALAERTDLAEHISKLEEDYDHDVFDTQMGDLKEWLQQRGVRVD